MKQEIKVGDRVEATILTANSAKVDILTVKFIDAEGTKMPYLCADELGFEYWIFADQIKLLNPTNNMKNFNLDEQKAWHHNAAELLQNIQSAQDLVNVRSNQLDYPKENPFWIYTTEAEAENNLMSATEMYTTFTTAYILHLKSNLRNNG